MTELAFPPPDLLSPERLPVVLSGRPLSPQNVGRLRGTWGWAWARAPCTELPSLGAGGAGARGGAQGLGPLVGSWIPEKSGQHLRSTRNG